MTAFILPTLIFPDQAGLTKDIERIAALGADGIEVRRERLMPTASLLHQAKDRIQSLHLQPVIYSAPADLWQEGRLNQNLSIYANEADSLGADWLKLGLGNMPDEMDTAALKRQLLKLHCRLLLENSQLALRGGTAKSFAKFFRELPAGLAAMTFDTGNWQTVGESTEEAYAMLKKYIAYVHIKAVEKTKNGWISCPVQPEDDWFSCSRHHDMAAVEFPMQHPEKEGKFWLSQLRGEK